MNKPNRTKWLVINICFWLTTFVGCDSNNSHKSYSRPTQYSLEEQNIRRNPINYINIKKKYNADKLFGGISDGLLSIKNESDFMFDRIVIKVYYIKTDGGVHKTATVVARNIQSQDRVHEPFPDSERGTSIYTKIQLIECSALDIHKEYIVE